MSQSAPMSVAVLGGHGKTGRAVTAALRRRGLEPRPVGRAGWDQLAGALDGCTSTYLLAPNMHPDEPAYIAAALDACRSAGVSRVVHHSVTAPYAPGMPHHVGKAVAEDLVRRSGLRWTVLQPCAYVQNFVPALRERRLQVAYDVDVPFGLVDLEDVAEAAATVLADEVHGGATYELGGPALVSVRGVAAAAAQVLGGVVQVEQIRLEQFRADVDDRTRDWLLRMFDYYDQHGLPAGPLPLGALLGRPPRHVAAVLARELRPG